MTSLLNDLHGQGEERFEVFRKFGILTRNMPKLSGYHHPNIRRANMREVSEQCFEENKKIRGEDIYVYQYMFKDITVTRTSFSAKLDG